jgi:hypothetical protein
MPVDIFFSSKVDKAVDTFLGEVICKLENYLPMSKTSDFFIGAKMQADFFSYLLLSL